MAKIFIPELGTRFLLAETWEFYLYNEYRNDSFLEALGYQGNGTYYRYSNDCLLQEGVRNPLIEIGEWDDSCLYTVNDNRGHSWRSGSLRKKMRLPRGTVLTLDRIYIRKGSDDFNSLSFNLNYCPEPGLCPKSGFKNMGGKKATIPLVQGQAGRIRFWVKLDDVNDKFDFVEGFKGDFSPD